MNQRPTEDFDDLHEKPNRDQAFALVLVGLLGTGIVVFDFLVPGVIRSARMLMLGIAAIPSLAFGIAVLIDPRMGVGRTSGRLTVKPVPRSIRIAQVAMIVGLTVTCLAIFALRI